MAKRKIIWTHLANVKLISIPEFYKERNKSATYSAKLYKKISSELKLINNYPKIGIATDFDSVRGLIIDDFVLFYEITNQNIIVHTIWDCKQNPDDLIIKP